METVYLGYNRILKTVQFRQAGSHDEGMDLVAFPQEICPFAYYTLDHIQIKKRRMTCY